MIFKEEVGAPRRDWRSFQAGVPHLQPGLGAVAETICSGAFSMLRGGRTDPTPGQQEGPLPGKTSPHPPARSSSTSKELFNAGKTPIFFSLFFYFFKCANAQKGVRGGRGTTPSQTAAAAGAAGSRTGRVDAKFWYFWGGKLLLAACTPRFLCRFSPETGEGQSSLCLRSDLDERWWS